MLAAEKEEVFRRECAAREEKQSGQRRRLGKLHSTSCGWEEFEMLGYPAEDCYEVIERTLMSRARLKGIEDHSHIISTLSKVISRVETNKRPMLNHWTKSVTLRSC